MNNNNRHKKLSTRSGSGGQFATENREIFQELREIKNEVKEVKKLLIVNSLRRLVDNYEQITQTKQKKLEKDWELAEQDKVRNKEIAEWDRIQAEDEENSSN
jgi:anion-transporting  ArsA/GET3 family ATPase